MVKRFHSRPVLGRREVRRTRRGLPRRGACYGPQEYHQIPRTRRDIHWDGNNTQGVGRPSGHRHRVAGQGSGDGFADGGELNAHVDGDGSGSGSGSGSGNRDTIDETTDRAGDKGWFIIGGGCRNCHRSGSRCGAHPRRHLCAVADEEEEEEG